MGSLRHNQRRWGHLYTRRDAIWGHQVMVSDPELIKQVFTAEAGVFHAGEINAPAGFLLGQRSVMLLDGAPHVRERRRMTPPFHGDRMGAYATAMRDITLQEIAGWREGDALPLLPTMQQITMRVILRTVFGLDEGPRHDELMERMTAMLGRIQSPFGMLLVIPALQRDLGWLTPWAAFARQRARVNELLYAEIAERRAALAAPGGKLGNDVLSLLLQTRDEDGQGMTDEELRDELMTLLLAGHETTATSLCWAFSHILAHPEVEARILAEIAAAPDPTGPLPYLDAAIKESIRMSPIVPLLGRKTKRPLTLGGYEIPAETIVFPAVYLTHHRPDIYPDPESYRPERFLDKKPDPYTWFPFGGGVRRCLGMAFALYEMRVVLATLLPRGKLRLAGRAPLRVVMRGFSFAPEGGTRVTIAGPRERAA